MNNKQLANTLVELACSVAHINVVQFKVRFELLIPLSRSA